MEVITQMKITRIKPGCSWTDVNEIVEFRSINEFVDYIQKTPTNKLFADVKTLASKDKSSYRTKFTQTQSYEEAVELLQGGWKTEAQKLTKKFEVTKKDMKLEKQVKSVLDVVGFQPVVPLYLTGVPMNMVNRKPVNCKNKIVTINYARCYSTGVDAQKIQQEAVKCLQIIKMIEDKGYRTNLNLIMCSGNALLKIRLKSSNERLNVSKLAFPICHPAMFRRLFFRFVEVHPSYNHERFKWGYGSVISDSLVEKALKSNERKEIMLSSLLGAVGYGTSSYKEVNEIALEKYLENL